MSKVTAYLAGPYSSRERLVDLEYRLAAEGIDVTSTWLRGPAQLGPGGEEIGTQGEAAAEGLADAGLCRFLADRDIADIARADYFVMLAGESDKTQGKPSSGGKHVELGIAIANGKRILLVGEPENIFQTVDGVRWFRDLDAIGHYLSGVAAARTVAKSTVKRNRATAVAVFDALSGTGMSRGYCVDYVVRSLSLASPQSSIDLEESLRSSGRAYGRGAISYALRALIREGAIRVTSKVGNTHYYELATNQATDADCAGVTIEVDSVS